MPSPLPQSSPIPSWFDAFTPDTLAQSWSPWTVNEPTAHSPLDYLSSSSSLSLAAESDVIAPPIASPLPQLALVRMSPSPSTAVVSSPSSPSSLSPSSATFACEGGIERVDPSRRSSAVAGTVEQLEQHRTAEAIRRRREKAVLLRLEELCAPEGSGGAGERAPLMSATAVPSTVAAQRQQRRRQKHKRAKLSVLEACAQRIEQLERLLRESELANRMSEAHLQAMSDQVTGMMARGRESLQWLDASRALHGNAQLNERFAYTLTCCRTGRLLDANHTFFAVTQYTPSGVLQRVLDPVLALFDSSATPASELPLVRTQRSNGDSSGVKSEGAVRWETLRPLRQYPGSVRLGQELLTGARDSYRAPFRVRFADGLAYEVQIAVWLAEAEWVEEADGCRWRRPVSSVAAVCLDEVCSVDDDPFPVLEHGYA